MSDNAASRRRKAKERSGAWHCDYWDALKERRRKSTNDHPALFRRAVVSANKLGSR